MFLVGKSYKTLSGFKVTVQAITPRFIFGIFDNNSYGVFHLDGTCITTAQHRYGEPRFNLISKGF